jgi:formylglycine-generating enzyme required for sulfatase activity
MPLAVSPDFTVQPGLFKPDDARLRELKERLLKEDFAAWEEGAAVPDGPLPRPTRPLALPMLEWCRVEAEAAHAGGGVTAPAFHIGKFPVTNEQFQVFVDTPDGYDDEHWWNFSEDARRHRALHPESPKLVFPGPKRPRVMVSWFDALAFCRWLSTKTGLSIFLPTTSQWIRAAQGNRTTHYPWGNESDTSRCNTLESHILETTDVDRYPSGVSPVGAYDMSGNVWEWSFTKYDGDDATDARGVEERREHGGSWHFKLVDAARISILSAKSPPGHYDDNIGFRLACFSLL